MRVRKWYIREREQEMKEPQQQTEITSGKKSSALRVVYTNIDGLLSGVLKVRYYLRKIDQMCCA